MHSDKGAASAAQATELLVCLAYTAGPDLVRRLMATTCSSSCSATNLSALLSCSRSSVGRGCEESSVGKPRCPPYAYTSLSILVAARIRAEE